MRSRLLLAALALPATACGLFDFSGPSGPNRDLSVIDVALPPVWTAPTLLVTVDGTHYGPTAPDPASGATLTNTRDGLTGAITNSTLRIAVSGAGSSCQLTAVREGDDVPSITAGMFQLQAVTTGSTPNGALAPLAGESVAAPQGGFACNGSSCNGALFVLNQFDGHIAEGYLAGHLPNTSGTGASDVVCAFYVPLTVASP